MTTTEYHIALRRSAVLNEGEIKRRLTQAYAFILSWHNRAAGAVNVSQAGTASAAGTPGFGAGAQGTLYYEH